MKKVKPSNFYKVLKSRRAQRLSWSPWKLRRRLLLAYWQLENMHNDQSNRHLAALEMQAEIKRLEGELARHV